MGEVEPSTPVLCNTPPANGFPFLRPTLWAMDSNAHRKLAQLIAWGRVGIGFTAILAPTIMSRGWIGDAADQPATRMLARTMGGRDVALGMGALRALAISDEEARPWVALGGSADAMDAVATVISFASLPRRSRWGILALTVGAAVASTRAAGGLDSGAAGLRSVPTAG
jgi:hypothetical protein